MERLPQSESEGVEGRCHQRWYAPGALLTLGVLGLVAFLAAEHAGTRVPLREERVDLDSTLSEYGRGERGERGERLRKVIKHWKSREQAATPAPGATSKVAAKPATLEVPSSKEPQNAVKKTWETLQGSPKKFRNKPRVRREWRTLSQSMKEKVAKAFWIVKETKTLEGRRKYGENFNNHDDMLILHSCATMDPRCDEGHFGPQFMTFHRALLLKYERSLLAVDPTIEAMPYWNMAYDAQDGKYKNNAEKYIFTNNYFGSYYGTGINYQVIDGLFANWPVLEWTAERFGNKSYMAPDNKCIREEYFKGTVPSVCDQCCQLPKALCDCENLPGSKSESQRAKAKAKTRRCQRGGKD